MPPNTRITKEQIVNAAIRLLREKGIEAVTARKVAEESGCSSQPVFSHFPSIQKLREEAFQSICHGWMQDFKTWKDRPDYVAAIVLWIVDLARTWPCLYQTLFFSREYGAGYLLQLFKKAGIILDLLQYAQFYYQLERETCRDILMRAFFLLQGITDSIAVGGNLHFTDQQILTMMQRSVEDMVCGSQKRSTTR